jgi:hypothetical protein
MNSMACVTPQNSSNPTGLPDIFLYYTSNDGPVKLAQWWANQPWQLMPDPPFSSSAGFVGCDLGIDIVPIAWVMNNEKEQLEQWSYNLNNSNPWSLGK